MKRILLSCVCLTVLHIEQAFPVTGIIGGQNGNAAYAAFVDENGNLTTLDLGLPIGTIGIASVSSRAVAINSSGIGLIGGATQSLFSPYAAFVGPGTEVKPLTFDTTGGLIVSVALNNTGKGLIGGCLGDVIAPSAYYAAFVDQAGGVNPLPLNVSKGVIYSVAMNGSGVGLIGGQDVLTGTTIAPPYATFVHEGKGVNPLPLNVSDGAIVSVAVNGSGLGLIGGASRLPGATNDSAYATFVREGEGVNPLPLNVSNGTLFSVAINDAGLGLIGGYDILPGTTNYSLYGAFVKEEGSVLPLTLKQAGSVSYISSVAINKSGTGLIGVFNPLSGTGSGQAYAAFVDLEGSVNYVDIPAAIQSVAISDSGVGLVGGFVSGSGGGTYAPYAALIAPGGELTRLDFVGGAGSGAINSVAFPLSEATPTSISSNWGVFNSQFAASFALNSHMLGSGGIATAEKDNDLAFLAAADNTLPVHGGSKESSSPNTIWLAPFGNYVHQKAEAGMPKSNNSIGGFLLGYDYSYSDVMFGGALGYAYNYIALGSSGHGSVQEELATFYGSYKRDYLLVNFALWGGYYELYNKRNTLSIVASKGNTQGWIFSPHLEIATPFRRGICFEPFVMLDYANNWQGGFTEKGASGLNLIIDKHYSSVLRSEVGLRLFEEWDIKPGKFVFSEALSYVNQAPFYFGPVTTAFVASASSFPIAIGSSHVQNLGAVELNVSFLPSNTKYPYVSLGVQAEGGSSYQSYFGNIEIGKSF